MTPNIPNADAQPESFNSKSADENEVANENSLEVEKKLTEISHFHSADRIQHALVRVLASRSTAPLADSVIALYRVSTDVQKTDTLNAILHAVGIKAFLTASDYAISQHLNESSFVFQEHQATKIIPAQVGRIVQALEKYHSNLLEALCKVYAQSTLLIKELGKDTVMQLIEEIDR